VPQLQLSISFPNGGQRVDLGDRDLQATGRHEPQQLGQDSRVRGPATNAEALKQYERDHWGQKGAEKVRKLPAADPRVPSVELGELVMVVYRTKKGADQVLTDYEHEFSYPRPRLAYNESGLIIAGGRYRIETRGIVD